VSTTALTRYLVPTLAVLAVITATFGNLAAYPQTNLKRLLAYSTIAHAGYMMMGLATLTGQGAAAVLFYLIAYLFMNLGAFAIIFVVGVAWTPIAEASDRGAGQWVPAPSPSPSVEAVRTNPAPIP